MKTNANLIDRIGSCKMPKLLDHRPQLTPSPTMEGRSQTSSVCAMII